MTNLEAADLLDNLIGMVSDNHDSDYDEALSKGRDILKSEPCEDAISRQAAIDAMYALCDTGENLKENPWRDNPHIDGITDALDNLPSVTPKPKTGHWIKIEPYPMMEHEYKCSECYHGTDNPFENYCSECGAKMQGVEE